MDMMRIFWDAATRLDPGAASLDEANRFPICQRSALEALWVDAGFSGVASTAIDVPTVFSHFDDFWTPFLGGQGPAPGYVAMSTEGQRVGLREEIRATLPMQSDGSIALIARAWAVRGRSGSP